tara:strand:- start:964 stop:1896 length:933 start_codon:yes stop_codon:yes gene_type:complete
MTQEEADVVWTAWGREHYREYGEFGWGNRRAKLMNLYIRGKNGLLPPDDLEECEAFREEQDMYRRRHIHALDNNHLQQGDRVRFEPRIAKIDEIPECIEAIEMSYDIQTKMKPRRSGGNNTRNPRDILYDNLQGKLAEILVKKYNCPVGSTFQPLDFERYERGFWDSFDLISVDEEIEVSVKSGLAHHQMLLLPYHDYDKKGIYKHHPSRCDNPIHAFVRMDLDKREITKKLMEGPKSFTKWFLQKYRTIKYDAFFCSSDRVRDAVKNGNIIQKGVLLNGKTPMDAKNYYLLAYNMERDINRVCERSVEQ